MAEALRAVMAVAALRVVMVVEVAALIPAEVIAAAAIRAVAVGVIAAGEGARTAAAGDIRIANPRFPKEAERFRVKVQIESPFRNRGWAFFFPLNSSTLSS